MGITNHLRYPQHFIRENWPTYLLGYGGGIVFFFCLILISLVRSWYAYVTISMAILILLLYFLIASLWSAAQAYDVIWLRDTIFKIGKIDPQESIIQISLGRKYVPATFCRLLSTGKLLVYDVYNPQLTPGQSLARARRRSKFENDPRILWRDVSNNVLPLPDNCQRTVAMIHVASEYTQAGDQEFLLSEIYRVLKPGGQMLIAESIKSPSSLLTLGPHALQLKSCAHWETMIARAGFVMFEKINLRDLLCCWGFIKPVPREPGQLELDI